MANTGPLAPSVGRAVLHLFCRVGPSLEREAVVRAVKDAAAAGDQVVTVALLGHKADVGFMVIADDLWRLRHLQTALASAGLDVVGSYVSLTELSEYAPGLPEEMKQARLYPTLPPDGKTAFCFYPMSKRRGAEYNWYELGFEERKEFMIGHGAVGRRYRGRVLQLVTGSTGLDDWEWGVTLFANHPDDLKQCVYEMRFDVASARYAEFGPFVTGMVAEADEIVARLAGS
jgi:chlorite dismutase